MYINYRPLSDTFRSLVSIPLVLAGEDWRIAADAWIPPDGHRLSDIVIDSPVSSIKCSKTKIQI